METDNRGIRVEDYKQNNLKKVKQNVYYYYGVIIMVSKYRLFKSNRIRVEY